jgi:hypothetical protein
MIRPLHALAACIAFAAVAAPAAARAQVDVEIYDRTDGRTLPVTRSGDGRRWIVGEPRHEYGIRLRNLTGERVLAVVSVDGVNVVTGQTASTAQSGYVLAPWGEARIDGWRKDLSRVASFYFTALSNSYAARTGRPDDVGVIGVATFRERPAPRVVEPQWLDAPAARNESAGPASAPAAAPPARSAASDAAVGAVRGRAAKQEAESSRADARASELPAERLGTGHGRRLDSRVEWTNFERASDAPDSVVELRYDSRRNLVAMGVLPPDRYARTTPNPFPGGFVPDPR